MVLSSKFLLADLALLEVLDHDLSSFGEVSGFDPSLSAEASLSYSSSQRSLLVGSPIHRDIKGMLTYKFLK